VIIESGLKLRNTRNGYIKKKLVCELTESGIIIIIIIIIISLVSASHNFYPYYLAVVITINYYSVPKFNQIIQPTRYTVFKYIS